MCKVVIKQSPNAAMDYDLALGLASRKVTIYRPPCSKTVRVLENEEIVAILNMPKYLIIFSHYHNTYMNLETWAASQPIGMMNKVTATSKTWVEC